MKRILKIFLFLVLAVVLFFVAVVGHAVFKSVPVTREMDRLAREDMPGFVNYVHSKMDRQSLKAAVVWFQANHDKTTNFMIPLLYSELLAKIAANNRQPPNQESYKTIMTHAATMYIYGDAVMAGDYARCKDPAVRSGVDAVRTIFFPRINEYLTTEADRATREQVFRKGFALEEKILSRPPNESVCGHDLKDFNDGAIRYIPYDEWAAARSSTLNDMKAAYRKKYLPD
ncbi:MAG: hypothetical protein PHE27_09470 [Alphaproteobacteria bacterium]|nr:hypothetical protein [Alphaproteobacteria bacterium]